MWSPEYQNVGYTISRYFRAYGGFRALFRSPYLHVSAILTMLSFHTWKEVGWWDLPIAVLPNLVGFTLGGYAILLGFGDDKFRSLITGSRGLKPSPYITTSSTFAHFIVVQTLALIFALLAKARMLSTLSDIAETLTGYGIPHSDVRSIAVTIFWGLGYCLFSYAILLIFAATLGVYRLSMWYDKIPNQPKPPVQQSGN